MQTVYMYAFIIHDSLFGLSTEV